jgi:hypothetical protein
VHNLCEGIFGSSPEQRKRATGDVLASFSLGAAVAWRPTAVVLFATVQTTASLQQLVMAQVTLDNGLRTHWAQSYDGNDTLQFTHWQQCNDSVSNAAVYAVVGSGDNNVTLSQCDMSSTALHCSSSSAEAALAQSIAIQLRVLALQTSNSTAADAIDAAANLLSAYDFASDVGVANTTLQLGAQAFINATFWRASVVAPNTSRIDVRYVIASDGRPLTLEIDTDNTTGFVMTFWVVNTDVPATALQSALATPACCSDNASLCDDVPPLGRYLDDAHSVVPVATLLPAALLAQLSLVARFDCAIGCFD